MLDPLKMNDFDHNTNQNASSPFNINDILSAESQERRQTMFNTNDMEQNLTETIHENENSLPRERKKYIRFSKPATLEQRENKKLKMTK